MKVLLFDIDGTLMLSGGAGKRGMNRAFFDVFGVDNALEDLQLAGMTDNLIFNNACEKHGCEPSAQAHQDFKTRYVPYLREEIAKPHPEKRMMPGILPLLQLLQSLPEVALGLLTGNYQQGAAVKLGHFSLFDFFDFGAFGDDDADRNKLFPHAHKRFAEQHGNSVAAQDFWIIGDTPKDVECARPHGAMAMAVATGGYSRSTLADAKPDVLMDDLGDTKSFLGAIGLA